MSEETIAVFPQQEQVRLTDAWARVIHTAFAGFGRLLLQPDEQIIPDSLPGICAIYTVPDILARKDTRWIVLKKKESIEGKDEYRTVYSFYSPLDISPFKNKTLAEQISILYDKYPTLQYTSDKDYPYPPSEVTIFGKDNKGRVKNTYTIQRGENDGPSITRNNRSLQINNRTNPPQDLVKYLQALSANHWGTGRIAAKPKQEPLRRTKQERRLTVKKALPVAVAAAITTGLVASCVGTPTPTDAAKPTLTLEPMATVIARGTPTPLSPEDPLSAQGERIKKASIHLAIQSTPDNNGISLSQGATGFVIKVDDGNYYLVTNLHSLGSGENFSILYDLKDERLYQEGDKYYQITLDHDGREVLKLDSRSFGSIRPIYRYDTDKEQIIRPWDVVLFPLVSEQVEKMEGIIPLSLAARNSFVEEKEVLFAGYPTSFQYIYKARLKQIKHQEDGDVWIIDKRVYSGFSGSPVIDVQGNLIGLIFGESDYIGQSEIVPVDNVRFLLSFSN